MAKLTCVIGLCGSGKTYLSERIAKDTGAELFEGLVEKQETDLPRLLQCLKDDIDCIVEEISFCFADTRNAYMAIIKQNAPQTEVEWVCFENDVESANWNVTHRTNKAEVERHIEINSRVHQLYSYPDGCKLLAITRIESRT